MIVVSDTNILGSLAAGDALPSLLRLYARSRLVMPPAVQQELQTGWQAGAMQLEPVLQAIQANQIEVSDLSAEEELLTYNYPGSLNEGERQAIAIAQRRKATLLCNDQQAIRYCQQRRVNVVNLVAIPRQLWVKNVQAPDEVRSLIERMRQVEGLTLSPRQMTEVFASAE